MAEENPKDEWEDLHSKVEDAIKNHDASFIIKYKYKPYQIRYIQKCADVQKGGVLLFFSLSIFIIGLGIGIGSNFRQSRDYLSLIIGIGMIIGGYALLDRYWLPKQTTCDEIILNAEKRIQTLNKEEEKE